MAGTVTITVKWGEPRGKRLIFSEPDKLVVGRGDGCDLKVAGVCSNGLISRRHCLLEIDPPYVHVKDLGSLNGTYVNGQKIGQRLRGLTAEEAARCDQAPVLVEDGDEVWVGTAVLGVEVCEPPAAADEGPQLADQKLQSV